MIVKPLQPVEHSDKLPSSNDKAKGGYSLRALERQMSDEYDNFYLWREKTAKAFAYYDGDSITEKMAQMAVDYDLEARNTNLVARVVNVVLGQEEKSRRDPKPEPDDDDAADVSDVLAVKLKEAQRESNADQEIGTTYANQVKGGLGWCGVSRRADPFQYQYAVEDIPWREMTWDRRAKKADLSDRTWDRRSQWKDLGDVMALYPEHERSLRLAANNPMSSWDNDEFEDEMRVSFGEFRNAPQTSWFRSNRNNWIDGNRSRIRMSEVEYKVPATVAVMKIKGRTIIVDPQNQTHVEAISRGFRSRGCCCGICSS